jgi:hypothetical protein
VRARAELALALEKPIPTRLWPTPTLDFWLEAVNGRPLPPSGEALSNGIGPPEMRPSVDLLPLFMAAVGDTATAGVAPEAVVR